MKNNTMFYGLLIAGGLLAYYAFKKKYETDKSKTKNDLSSSTLKTFIDDKPIDITNLKGNFFLDNGVEKTKSQIVEPLIGTNQQNELTKQSELLES